MDREMESWKQRDLGAHKHVYTANTNHFHSSPSGGGAAQNDDRLTEYIPMKTGKAERRSLVCLV